MFVRVFVCLPPSYEKPFFSSLNNQLNKFYYLYSMAVVINTIDVCGISNEYELLFKSIARGGSDDSDEPPFKSRILKQH